MSISLRALTKDTWKSAIALETHEDQKTFVATNVHSMAETNFYEGAFFRGIYFDEVIVGFTLLYISPETPEEGYLARFMIDKNHQGKGYGQRAMKEILDLFKVEYKVKSVTLTVVPENSRAIKFYEKSSFVHTGKIVDNELQYRYNFDLDQ